MTSALKVTVLVSGSGSNLQALIDARQTGRLDIEISHVISNVATARGLQRAEQAGIPTSVLEHGAFADRDAFDRSLALLVAAGSPDLVVLAGFMRIIGPAVLAPFRGRMINLHPSLLPLYRGTNTYQRALDAGDSRMVPVSTSSRRNWMGDPSSPRSSFPSWRATTRQAWLPDWRRWSTGWWSPR